MYMYSPYPRTKYYRHGPLHRTTANPNTFKSLMPFTHLFLTVPVGDCLYYSGRSPRWAESQSDFDSSLGPSLI
jgi:hypothetical protein